LRYYVEIYVAEFSRLFSIILNEENGKEAFTTGEVYDTSGITNHQHIIGEE